MCVKSPLLLPASGVSCWKSARFLYSASQEGLWKQVGNMASNLNAVLPDVLSEARFGDGELRFKVLWPNLGNKGSVRKLVSKINLFLGSKSFAPATKCWESEGGESYCWSSGEHRPDPEKLPEWHVHRKGCGLKPQLYKDLWMVRQWGMFNGGAWL